MKRFFAVLSVLGLWAAAVSAQIKDNERLDLFHTSFETVGIDSWKQALVWQVTSSCITGSAPVLSSPSLTSPLFAFAGDCNGPLSSSVLETVPISASSSSVYLDIDWETYKVKTFQVEWLDSASKSLGKEKITPEDDHSHKISTITLKGFKEASTVKLTIDDDGPGSESFMVLYNFRVYEKGKSHDIPSSPTLKGTGETSLALQLSTLSGFQNFLEVYRTSDITSQIYTIKDSETPYSSGDFNLKNLLVGSSYMLRTRHQKGSSFVYSPFATFRTNYALQLLVDQSHYAFSLFKSSVSCDPAPLRFTAASAAIDFWMNSASSTSTVMTWTIFEGASTLKRSPVQISVADSSSKYHSLKVSINNVGVEVPGVVVPGRWMHVAVLLSQDKLNVAVDGQIRSFRRFGSEFIVAGDRFEIKMGDDRDDTGLVDEVRVWSSGEASMSLSRLMSSRVPTNTQQDAFYNSLLGVARTNSPSSKDPGLAALQCRTGKTGFVPSSAPVTTGPITFARPTDFEVSAFLNKPLTSDTVFALARTTTVGSIIDMSGGSCGKGISEKKTWKISPPKSVTDTVVARVGYIADPKAAPQPFTIEFSVSDKSDTSAGALFLTLSYQDTNRRIFKCTLDNFKLESASMSVSKKQVAAGENLNIALDAKDKSGQKLYGVEPFLTAKATNKDDKEIISEFFPNYEGYIGYVAKAGEYSVDASMDKQSRFTGSVRQEAAIQPSPLVVVPGAVDPGSTVIVNFEDDEFKEFSMAKNKKFDFAVRDRFDNNREPKGDRVLLTMSNPDGSSAKSAEATQSEDSSKSRNSLFAFTQDGNFNDNLHRLRIKTFKEGSYIMTMDVIPSGASDSMEVAQPQLDGLVIEVNDHRVRDILTIVFSVLGSLLVIGIVTGIVTGYLIRRRRKNRTKGATKDNVEDKVVGEEHVGDKDDVPKAQASLTDALSGGSLLDPESVLKAQIKIRSDKFEINFEELKITRAIGRGAYGVVYCADWNSDVVAVKAINFNTGYMSTEDVDHIVGEFENEVQMLSEHRHPHLLTFMGACISPPNLCIVTEYMENGSLHDILSSKRITLNWVDKVEILLQVAQGINYLHKKDLIHRDLKSHNVFIDNHLNAKVGDFGLARVFNHIEASLSTMTKFVGSPVRSPHMWMAPEVARGEKYDKACDVYSFGVMMSEIFNEKPPFFDVDHKMSIPFRVSSDPTFRPNIREEMFSVDPIIKHSQEWYLELMKRCWADQGHYRPTFKTICTELTQMKNRLKEDLSRRSRGETVNYSSSSSDGSSDESSE